MPESEDTEVRPSDREKILEAQQRTMPPHPDFARKDVPRNVVLGEFRMVELTPRDLVEDYEAVLAAAPYIRGVFDGNWPDSLTLADNLADLTRHEREFSLKRSFAWIIRDVDGRYVGCAYLNPKPDTSGAAAAYYWIANLPQRDAVLERFSKVYEPWIRNVCGPDCKISFRCR